MFRMYSNENFPLPVVEELSRLGCDVMTVEETGKAGQAWPDADVLSFSAAENRVLLTLNRKDFFRLHRQQPDHAGIVACTFDPAFAAQAGRIFEVLQSASDLRGVLLRVNRPSA